MPDVPIDGTHCMACGHPWLLHHMRYGCNELACACQRPSTERESFNSHDWQARIRELEDALATMARELSAARTIYTIHAAKLGAEDDEVVVIDSDKEAAAMAALCEHRPLTNANPTCAAAIAKARKE